MFFPTAEVRNEERAKYIEKQKQRQELQRQQEERIAAARKAAEKAPHETAMDKLKETIKLINSIQIGSPMNEEYITAALKQICDILDYCLTESRPEINSEE